MNKTAIAILAFMLGMIVGTCSATKAQYHRELCTVENHLEKASAHLVVDTTMESYDEMTGIFEGAFLTGIKPEDLAKICSENEVIHDAFAGGYDGLCGPIYCRYPAKIDKFYDLMY